MKKEDIIRMAQEAGFVVDEKAQQHQPNCIFHTHHMVDELLERFAKLVYEATFRDANIAASRTILDAAVAEEREACAKVCEAMRPSKPEFDRRYYQGCTDTASAIRSRQLVV